MKDTCILREPFDYSRAASILTSGGLVVFPTETVYGLGANAFDASAVESIFRAKGRPSDNPLIVHIDSVERLPEVAVDPSETALRLFEQFSPGPISIVLKRSPKIPAIVSAGLDTVAVRIPAHPVCRKLLETVGVPIAAPSANLSGKPSPTSFEMAYRDMNGRADAILDGGNSRHGLESTVIRVAANAIELLRPGSVTAEMISDFIGLPVRMAGNVGNSVAPAPGMKYPHYKPEAEVILVDRIDPAMLAQRFENKKIGILTMQSFTSIDASMHIRTFVTLEDYARELYRSLVELDAWGADIAVAETVPETGLGAAIMNRLKKASGGKYAV